MQKEAADREQRKGMKLHPEWGRKGGQTSFGTNRERTRVAGRKSGEVRRQQRQLRRPYATHSH